MTTPKFDEAFLDLQRTLTDAEFLARDLPDSFAVVYRKAASGQMNSQQRPKSTSFVVLPAGAPAPQGAEIFTTVSRKPPSTGGSGMSLLNAVQHMLENLPNGIELAGIALIEYYPQKYRWGTPEPREIFAYEFMSTEGRNIGTWIPSFSMSGVSFQLGYDGRGRVYGSPIQGRVDLRELIDRVREMQDVDREPTNSYPTPRG